jgi:hypothetical protein
MAEFIDRRQPKRCRSASRHGWLSLRSYGGSADDVVRRWGLLPEGVHDPRNETLMI